MFFAEPATKDSSYCLSTVTVAFTKFKKFYPSLNSSTVMPLVSGMPKKAAHPRQFANCQTIVKATRKSYTNDGI
jgi:hypothetical protein